MSGGMLQLVSYGSADIHLTGAPQVTFWRQVFRRYTNFAVEPVLNVFHGTPDFGRKASVTLSRTADLINRVYVEIVLPALPPVNSQFWKAYNEDLNIAELSSPDPATDSPYLDWVNDVGLALIQAVELEIGGTRYDRHTSEWMHMWASLTLSSDKKKAFDRMVGHVERPGDRSRGLSTKEPVHLYVPLMFFFTQYGLSLPMVAISYHDIKLNFEFRTIKELLVLPPWLQSRLAAKEPKVSFVIPDDTQFKMDSCRLYADMVFVSEEERRRNARMAHEILFQNVQFLGDEVVDATALSSGKWNLNFSHPCKEILWVFVEEGKGLFEYSNVFDDVHILMNGHMRLSPRKASYFYLVQPWQHHTGCPDDNFIHCYSFALHPEDTQASGTMNFSRLNQANLLATFSKNVKGKLKFFALGYNVMRVASGLAGLAYTT
jgi:hypothetical protein